MYYLQTKILLAYYGMGLGAIWYANTYNLVALFMTTLVICVIGRRKDWGHVNDARIIYSLVFTIAIDGINLIWIILYIVITIIGLGILSEDYQHDKEVGNVQ